MLNEFIAEYGSQILYTVITAIAGYFGYVAKNLVTKYLNDKTKKSVAKTVVQAAEQIWKNLNGEEKLNKALEAMAEMLAEKGISTTELEMRMLIESAVGEFNNVFNKTNFAESEEKLDG